MYDPHTDLVTADWHPLVATSWIMPLLVDLSDWRTKLDDIEMNVYKGSNDTNVIFIADFPGIMKPCKLFHGSIRSIFI